MKKKLGELTIEEGKRICYGQKNCKDCPFEKINADCTSLFDEDMNEEIEVPEE